MAFITGDYAPNPPITETDDLPNDLSTPVSLIPSQALNGTIDSATGDRGDWVSVELEAGQDYTIRMDGIDLTDPFLFLLDSAGNVLRSNDDWNGLNSRIAFTPSETGTYFVRATFFRHWDPDFQPGGSYTLSISLPGGQHLYGTGLNDTIIGNTDRDTIEGFAGDDWIDGNGGGDRIFSGSGDDTVTNAGYGAQISTGEGNDSVEGGERSWMWTGAGADTVVVTDDHYEVHTGQDDDMVTVVLGETSWGTSRIYTWFGDDTVDVEGRATVYGGPGNDLIRATGPEAVLRADGDTGRLDYSDHGNDTIIGGSQSDRIDGGFGDDSLVGNAGDDYVFGGSGDDSLSGGEGFDVLQGGSGDDTIDGGWGDDQIFGGDGNNSIDGGGGNDFIWGESGNDTLNGGADADTVFGEEGDDVLDGGDGNDRLWSGDGNDTVSGGEGDDQLGGGQSGDDSLSGNQGNDQIWAGAGNDTLSGGYGNDTLYGGTGDDLLYGDDGDDLLDGGQGSNLLDGGAGDDTLIARSATDTVVFSEGDDLLMAFAPGSGARIDLSGVTSITDFADLLANHLSDTDLGAVIDDGLGNTLTLDHLLIADLGADDFLF